MKLHKLTRKQQQIPRTTSPMKTDALRISDLLVEVRSARFATPTRQRCGVGKDHTRNPLAMGCAAMNAFASSWLPSFMNLALARVPYL